MKKCPFCAKDIQAEAVECEHCGKMLSRVTRKTTGGSSDQNLGLLDTSSRGSTMQLLSLIANVVVFGFLGLMVWAFLHQ